MKKLLGSIIFLTFFGLYLHCDINISSLVDAKDSYPTTAYDGDEVLSFITKVLFFVAGFLVAKFKVVSKIKDRLSKP